MEDPQPKPKLTPQQKDNWNKLIDFVALQKMANHPSLDQRNKQVGMSLIQKFNFANPKNAIEPSMIPDVQQELQDYRSGLVNDYKAGKAHIGDIKSDAEIMPGLSIVDSWPGTKTLSSKFPTASFTTIKDGKAVKQSFGTDIAAYDKIASNK